jgi:hypothetical protein
MKRLATACLLLVLLLLPALSCKNAQQAQAGIFTGEQIVCMVAGLAENVLVGTPDQVAADIVAFCPELKLLSANVVAFVTQWMASAPAKRTAWKMWAREHTKTMNEPSPPGTPGPATDAGISK